MLLRQDQRKRAAFTLMEIIVVVAIILILAGAGAVVLPRFLSDANVGRAKTDIKSLETAVMAYQAKSGGRLPDTLDQLAEIQQDGGPAYIEASLLTDPWGNRYHYDRGTVHPKTQKPLISSQGPPGQNVLIRNWND